jgi:hypothetical protein
MKICFHAPAGELSETLRRSVQEALGQPLLDLSETAPRTWKEAIAGADLAFVDITAANAAACYLVGLADAIGRRVVLLAPIEESIPAIFENCDVIVHRWNLELLKTELRKLTVTTTDEKAPAVTDDSPAGKFQQMFGDLLRTHGYVHRGSVEFDGATFILREQDMDLPLVQEISNRAKSLNVRVRLL